MKGSRDMKAKVFYKDYDTGKYRQKTVEIEKNDPNEAVRKFVELTGNCKSTYITHIRCGRYDYQWKGDANLASW